MVKEKTQKAKKEKAPKPKYNMAQNSWFMIKLAREKGYRAQLVIRTFRCGTQPYQSVCFPHDTLCGGATGIGHRADRNNSGIRCCADARFGGILVCEHEHPVRKNQRSLRDHQSAKQKDGNDIISEYQ